MSTQSREIATDHGRFFTCPNGCNESEIEIGKEHQSFMAMLGSPHMFIRCGVCGFNEDHGRNNLRFTMADCVHVWNAACFVEAHQ